LAKYVARWPFNGACSLLRCTLTSMGFNSVARRGKEGVWKGFGRGVEGMWKGYGRDVEGV